MRSVFAQQRACRSVRQQVRCSPILSETLEPVHRGQGLFSEYPGHEKRDQTHCNRNRALGKEFPPGCIGGADYAN